MRSLQEMDKALDYHLTQIVGLLLVIIMLVICQIVSDKSLERRIEVLEAKQ